MTIYPLQRLPKGYFRRALEIGERIQAGEIIGLTKGTIGWYEAFQGNWEKTLALCREAGTVSSEGRLQWAIPDLVPLPDSYGAYLSGTLFRGA